MGNKNLGSLVNKVLGNSWNTGISNLLLKVGLLGSIIAITYIAVDQSRNRNIESRIFFPDLSALPAPLGKSFDYCQLTDESSNLDRYFAGEDIKPEILYPRDFHQDDSYQEEFQTIDDIVLTKDNIIQVTPSNPKNRYQLLLVGVGYKDETLDKDLSRNATQLAGIYAGMNIDFSYLNIPIPFEISRIQSLPALLNSRDGDLLLAKANEKMPVDGILVVLNSGQFLGGNHYYPVIAGHNNINGLYLAAHELAHFLGLDDGHNRYYKDSGFGGSELFRNYGELKPHVLRAVTIVDPEIGNTGNTCNGAPVYAFYRDIFNIMGRFNYNDLFNRVLTGKPLFNPLQIQIMNDFIADAIANRIEK